LEEAAEDRHAQFKQIEITSTIIGLEIEVDKKSDCADYQGNQDDIVAHEIGKPDDDAGSERKLGAGLGQDGSQIRNDVNHEDNGDANQADENENRIDHRPLNLGDHVIILFRFIGQIIQDLVQLTRGFAGTDDIDEKVGKNLRPLSQGIRQERAAFDFESDFREQILKGDILGLVDQDEQGFNDRHVSGNHHRKLAGKNDNIFVFDWRDYESQPRLEGITDIEDGQRIEFLFAQLGNGVALVQGDDVSLLLAAVDIFGLVFENRHIVISFR